MTKIARYTIRPAARPRRARGGHAIRRSHGSGGREWFRSWFLQGSGRLALVIRAVFCATAAGESDAANGACVRVRKSLCQQRRRATARPEALSPRGTHPTLGGGISLECTCSDNALRSAASKDRIAQAQPSRSGAIRSGAGEYPSAAKNAANKFFGGPRHSDSGAGGSCLHSRFPRRRRDQMLPRAVGVARNATLGAFRALARTGLQAAHRALAGKVVRACVVDSASHGSLLVRLL